MQAWFNYIQYCIFICIFVQKYTYINLRIDCVNLLLCSYNIKFTFIVIDHIKN